MDFKRKHFFTEHMLEVPLTVVDQFHSHLEPMEYIAPDTFADQVIFFLLVLVLLFLY